VETAVMMNRDFPDGRQGANPGPQAARFSAGHLLMVLRRHQIPCSIDSFSDSGWTARLGDPAEGPYSQQGCFPSHQAAAEWLLQEAARRGAVRVPNLVERREP
jgi:hypothetical protein